ncbi:hypothetical protein [Actinomadura sp. DC4]|nr:hypothetical protein [Actinomadura sp. DC4]MDN3359572.1 hypothetical protein [Actinomadura sp. DC4]
MENVVVRDGLDVAGRARRRVSAAGTSGRAARPHRRTTIAVYGGP